jgi:D-sedoheptulose 7-phosphate isomerase
MNDPRAIVRAVLGESARAVAATEVLEGPIADVATRICDALAAGHAVIAFGNGGSAADAEHFVAELVGRFGDPARPPLHAVALAGAGAIVTAIANDFAYEDVFARQIAALARDGDVLVAISTSGRSPSVLRAIAAAPAGVLTIAITGSDGPLAEAASVTLHAPGRSTAAIQAAHIAILHAIAAVADERFRPQ